MFVHISLLIYFNTYFYLYWQLFLNFLHRCKIKLKIFSFLFVNKLCVLTSLYVKDRFNCANQWTFKLEGNWTMRGLNVFISLKSFLLWSEWQICVSIAVMFCTQFLKSSEFILLRSVVSQSSRSQHLQIFIQHCDQNVNYETVR